MNTKTAETESNLKSRYWDRNFISKVRDLTGQNTHSLIVRILLERSIANADNITHPDLLNKLLCYANALWVKVVPESVSQTLTNLIDAGVIEEKLGLEQWKSFGITKDYFEYFKTEVELEKMPPLPGLSAASPEKKTIMFDYWSSKFINGVSTNYLSSDWAAVVRILLENSVRGGVGILQSILELSVFAEKDTQGATIGERSKRVLDDLVNAGVVEFVILLGDSSWRLSEKYYSRAKEVLTDGEILSIRAAKAEKEPVVNPRDWRIFTFTPGLEFSHRELLNLTRSPLDAMLSDDISVRIAMRAPGVTASAIRAFAQKVTEGFTPTVPSEVASCEDIPQLAPSALSGNEFLGVMPLDPYVASLMEDLERATGRLKKHLNK